MLQSITARCHYLPCEKETDRPCLGYVRGDRISLLIDAGNSPAHYRAMQEAIARCGLPAPGLAAITHAHWDHTYGMAACTVPVMVNHATQQHLQRMSAWAWTLPAMEQRLRTGEDILFCHECILKEYPDLSAIRVRTGDIVYRDRLTLDLGGVHAILMHLENSHADDCSIVYIPEEKVVYLGDITYEDLHHTPPCIHQARYAALRKALEETDFTLAVPGHQGLKTKAEILHEFDTIDEEGLMMLP